MKTIKLIWKCFNEALEHYTNRFIEAFGEGKTRMDKLDDARHKRTVTMRISATMMKDSKSNAEFEREIQNDLERRLER